MSLTIEQQTARAQGIGASEAVILFTNIPKPPSLTNQTPYQLWLLKTGKLQKDAEPDDDFQWWGHALEPIIASRYEYETGDKLEYRPETVIHPRLPYMLCHPDRYLLRHDILVEIKTSNEPSKWGEPLTDQIPAAYYLQCQHQMACTGFNAVHVIVYFPNFRKSAIYVVKRDNDIINQIETAVTKFWTYNVEGDIPPDLISLADAKLKYPAEKFPEYIEADEPFLNQVADLRLVKSEIKRLEKAQEDLMLAVYQFTGNYAGVTIAGELLYTLKATKRGYRTLRFAGDN